MLQPLFKEIDELEYGGNKLAYSRVRIHRDENITELLSMFALLTT